MRQLIRAFFFLGLLSSGITGSYGQTASFTASATSGCAPLLVQFTSTSTGTVTSYSWNLGNGVYSTNQNPSTSYTSPGSYTVTLTINGPGGSTITKTNYITIYPAPTISFTYSNATGCTPLLVPFVSNVTPGVPGTVSYSWYYGDGYSGNGATSSHLYTTPGTYNVTLSATNSAGCTSSLQQLNVVTAYPKPGGAFGSAKTNYCSVPATVSFINTASSGTGPYSVYWEFGDGSNSSSSNPTHTYSSAGSFTVSLVTMDARGCKDTVVKTNYITTHIPNATFSAPTSGCKKQGSIFLSDSILFKNTTSGGANTTWDFGDNTGDVGDSVYHRYSDTLAYTVTMITLNSGCYDTARKVVKIYPNPVDTIHYLPNPNCGVPATFVFWSTGPSTSYKWAWGLGGTSTANTPTKYYSTGAIVDTAKLIATDIHGCKDTTNSLVYVHKPYAQVFGPINGCVPFGGKYSARLKSDIYPPLGIFPDSITSVYWDFGDGSTSSLDTPTHYYTTYGTYHLALKFTTASGCVIYDTVLIHAGTKIYPSFTATPNPVCAGQEVYFTNTTGVPASSTVTYTWDVGDGAYTPVNNMDAAHIYIIPGVYTIKLIITNNGCDDTALKTNWMVVNGPNANFVDTPLCINQHRTIHLNNMSIGSTSQLWFFGDNTTDTAFAPYHTYATGGTYTVTLTTYNSTTGCRDTLSLPIAVGPPTLTFAALDTTLCLGDTLKINSSYSGIPANVTFAAGGAVSVNGPSPLLKYFVMNATGYHSVYMISNSMAGCIDSAAKRNYIFVSKPVAKFKGTPLLGCTPLNVTFIDTSLFTSGAGLASRTWTFGNGSVTTAASSITNTYTTAGKYSVKLKTVDSNGCADSLTKTNFVEARHPTAAFQAGVTAGCVGQSFSFANGSTGATGLVYRWNFGDGDTSSAKDPSHTYRAPGSYTVRLVAIDSSGCSDTLSMPGYIRITRPAASFKISDSLSVCPPLTVKFTSTSAGANGYDWDFANGSTAAYATPSSLFTTPGVYTVRLIVTDANGCPDTAIGNVRVLGYAGALTYTPLAGCVPLTVNFLATNTGVPKMVWDFSDGDTAFAFGNTISHTYHNGGAYVPKLIFYDSRGCSASSTGLDTIKVDDVIADFKVLPPCEKTPLLLTDASKSLFSPLSYWLWEFAPGQIATGQSVPRVYPAPGSYPVKLIVRNSRGCADTLSRNFTIYPLPKITASPDTFVCIPDAVTISASGGVSYTWSPPSSLSCTACTSPQAAPAVGTFYIVIGTDSNGCANKDTVRIGIQTKSTFAVTSGGEICLGQHFQLFAGGATLYHWTPSASLDNADSAAPVATPTVTTTYVATGREGSCAADTHTVKVVVNPLPSIDAGKDDRVIAGNSIQLQASGTGATRIEWKADPALSCTDCYAPFASPRITTTFYVTAYTTKGCTATDSVTVHVLCDGSQLFIPNTFSPNGDGLNDYFFPRGRGIETVNSFKVYSRWGELMYERTAMPVNDEYAGWNGTYNGQKLPPDVYVYLIEANCENGEPIKWKGDVTLIR